MIVGSNGLNRLSVQVLQEQFFAHFHVLALVESSQEFLKPSIIKPSRQKKTTFASAQMTLAITLALETKTTQSRHRLTSICAHCFASELKRVNPHRMSVGV